jgi:hypothetical protein
MSEWQPIKTAPKDGTRIILYWPAFQCPIEIGHYEDSQQLRHGKEISRQQYWYRSQFPLWGVQGGKIGPSHWMPLPKPPKGQKS